MASKDITLCISAPRCGFMQCKRNPANYPPSENYSMAESAGYTPKTKEG